MLIKYQLSFPFCFASFSGNFQGQNQTVNPERGRERAYANRSMMGAQFLEAMRARRLRRALSISLRYSVSTTGNAMETTLALQSPTLTTANERGKEERMNQITRLVRIMKPQHSPKGVEVFNDECCHHSFSSPFVLMRKDDSRDLRVNNTEL